MIGLSLKIAATREACPIDLLHRMIFTHTSVHWPLTKLVVSTVTDAIYHKVLHTILTFWMLIIWHQYVWFAWSRHRHQEEMNICPQHSILKMTQYTYKNECATINYPIFVFLVRNRIDMYECNGVDLIKMHIKHCSKLNANDVKWAGLRLLLT